MFKNLTESYSSIKYTKRLFYPRNLELSKEFITAFKTELNRLLSTGHKPKAILDKIAKALIFHSRK